MKLVLATALVLASSVSLLPSVSFAKSSMVLTLDIHSSIDESKATAPGIYSEVRSSGSSTMSVTGTGKLSSLSQTHTMNQTVVNGVDTKSVQITTITPLAGGSILLSVQESAPGRESVANYSGEARFVEGTFADYQAGKTVRIEQSPEFVKNQLSAEGYALGQVLAEAFNPMLKSSAIALSTGAVKSRSAGPQTCYLSLQSLRCESGASQLVLPLNVNRI